MLEKKKGPAAERFCLSGKGFQLVGSVMIPVVPNHKGIREGGDARRSGREDEAQQYKS